MRVRSISFIVAGIAGIAAFGWYAGSIFEWAMPGCEPPIGYQCHPSHTGEMLVWFAMLIPISAVATGVLGLVSRGPLAGGLPLMFSRRLP